MARTAPADPRGGNDQNVRRRDRELAPLIGHLRLDRFTADQIATAMRLLGDRKRTTRDGADGTQTVQQA